MTTALALGGSICVAGVVILLLAYTLRETNHKRQACNLASAFIGEIVAILDAIETHNITAQLEQAVLHAPKTSIPFDNLILPPFVIYDAEANRLEELDAPLPRKITNFYTRLGSLQIELGMIGSKSISEASNESYHMLARTLLKELKEMLNLANDILRDLRRVAAPHDAAKSLL